MCGRFTLRTPAPVLIAHFELDLRSQRLLPLFEPRYNIAPTQEIAVVRADPADGRRTASMLRWGLVPAWSKEPLTGRPMINARAETLAQKPAFRSAYRSRRCLIPADGFYEWQPPAGGRRGKKQPFHIHRPDGGPFAFAGLWETWRARPSAKGSENKAGTARRSSPPALFDLQEDQAEPLIIESCTIVTTAANAALSALHDRMPVILAPGDYATWLDPELQDPAALAHLLAPCGDEELVAEPASTLINRVASDEPPED